MDYASFVQPGFFTKIASNIGADRRKAFRMSRIQNGQPIQRSEPIRIKTLMGCKLQRVCQLRDKKRRAFIKICRTGGHGSQVKEKEERANGHLSVKQNKIKFSSAMAAREPIQRNGAKITCGLSKVKEKIESKDSPRSEFQKLSHPSIT